MHKCPRCGVSWHKVKDDNECNSVKSTKKGPPAKVLWYLLIIPRFKHLFANGDDAKNLRWNAEGKKNDGLLRHPADSPQWKEFDHLYPDFGNEPRNIRVA